jgi:tetratricopeptide (TPR) repeat protein
MRLLLIFALTYHCFAETEINPNGTDPYPVMPEFTPTPSMQAFLQNEDIHPYLEDSQKIDALLSALYGPEGKDFTYAPNLTLPPGEAFETRQGNCLTFAMLFVTLAREIGLNAVFNEVDASPGWEREGDIIIETGHINILVRSKSRNYVIEWVEYYRDLSSLFLHPISDERAISHYFNNLGIRSMSEKDYPRSLFCLEQALDIDPTNANAWQNYGVYWIRQKQMDKAEEAFLKGIKLSGKQSSIYFLLSRFYEQQGDKARALIYLKKGKRYAKKNPFYNFNQAMEAKEQKDDKKAVKYLNSAIRKLPDYHRFHYELAMCYYRMGKAELWKNEMEKAIQSTDSPEIKLRYRTKMDELLGVEDSP